MPNATRRPTPRATERTIEAALRDERAKRPACEVACNSIAITNNCCACVRAVAARLLNATL